MSPSVMKCSGSTGIRFYLLSWLRIRIQKLSRSGSLFKPILTRKPFEVKLCSTFILKISVYDFVSITRIPIFPSRIQGQKGTGSRIELPVFLTQFSLGNMIRDLQRGSRIPDSDFFQCCGSGSSWIRIHLALLGPDP